MANERFCLYCGPLGPRADLLLAHRCVLREWDRDWIVMPRPLGDRADHNNAASPGRPGLALRVVLFVSAPADGEAVVAEDDQFLLDDTIGFETVEEVFRGGEVI